MVTDVCDQVVANLSSYIDGDIDAQQERLFENHLAHCPQCAATLKTMTRADLILEREWRDSAPLPSSLETTRAIEAIMDALPSMPAEPAAFAPHRIHARTRWIRFASGALGIMALYFMLWTSYSLGYAEGRKSRAGSAATESLPPTGSLSARDPMHPPVTEMRYRIRPQSHLTAPPLPETIHLLPATYSRIQPQSNRSGGQSSSAP